MFDEYPKWISTDETDPNVGFIVISADEEAERVPKSAKKASAPPKADVKSADPLV